MKMPPNLPWLTQDVYDKMPVTERALVWAASQVGVTEEPKGSNRGKQVEEYLKSVGLGGGYPWCDAFVKWCLIQAGVDPKKLLEFDGLVKNTWHAAGKEGAIRTNPKRGYLGGFLNKDGTGHIYYITDVNGDGSWTTIEGNAQPLTSNVLTPTGWKQMGELKLGDRVVDPRGWYPSVVEGIFPQGKIPVFKITFSDGSTVEASEDHLWEVEYYSHGKRAVNTISTKEIQTRLKSGTRLRLPQLSAPDLKGDLDLPIDPYVLGLLIGDGGLSTKAVRFTTNDQELVAAISEKQGCTAKKYGESDYNLVYPEQRNNPLRQSLNELDLTSTSEFKHIPQRYILTSKENREALLQGILDTDGHADTRGRIEWTTVSKQLAEDVKELVLSLGGKAKIQYRSEVWYTSPTQEEKKQAKPAYRLAIRLPRGVQAFRLGRKQQRVDARKAPNRGLQRAFKSVEYIRDDYCQCIKVSAPSKLYITDNWVPTHNTNNDGSREGYEVARKKRSRNSKVFFIDTAVLVAT